MNFILTRYIYPIEEKIFLSEKLNLFMDNPRTSEEINFIKDIIKSSNESSGHRSWPPYNKDIDSDDYVTMENALEEFYKNFRDDKYVHQFCQENDLSDVYEFIAKMVIILHFDDEGQLRELAQVKDASGKSGKVRLIMLDDKHPLVRNSKLAEEYSYLLSLLINTEHNSFYGTSILFGGYNDFPIFNFEGYFHQVLSTFLISSYRKPNGNDKDSLWKYFSYIIEQIKGYATIFDEVFKDEKKFKKLMFISNILKNVGGKTEDSRLKIVTLVSIIEMLLTHNPDFNRYNVEDSINKQFQLKSTIVVYMNDKSEDINRLKDKFKLFYSLRSNIAHGNFESTDKIMKKIYQIYQSRIDNTESKDDYNVYYSIIIGELYYYIKIIIISYLHDSEFIDFLKDS